MRYLTPQTLFSLVCIFSTGYHAGLVSAKKGKLCGYNIETGTGEIYDPTTEDCIDGKVVSRIPITTKVALITTSSPKLTESPAVGKTAQSSSVDLVLSTSSRPDRTTQKSPSSPRPETNRCLTPDDVNIRGFTCSAEKLFAGYQCCGSSGAFDPLKSTCCKQMSDIKIFHGKPEKDHICCYDRKSMSIHQRGSQPCLVPAANDKLWEPELYRDMRKVNMCDIQVYAYVQFRFSQISAILILKRMWNWTSIQMGTLSMFAYIINEFKTPVKDKLYGYIKLQQIYPNISDTVIEKRVEVDQYSDWKTIKTDSRIVVSMVDQAAKIKFPFFTYSKDHVYKLPGCKCPRWVAKIHKNIARQIKRSCKSTKLN